MRKLIISLHTTLDGFVAGPAGEMDWIRFDQEMFDFVGQLTEEADTALYGRVTYQMMDSYWPTAADKENASKHDIEHSQWYNKVQKIVLSRTMHNSEKLNKTTFINDHVAAEITKLKNEPGKNIIIFGSPGAAHFLMEHQLIDEFWLFVNPVILGKGIPVFSGATPKTALQRGKIKLFDCGVTGINYNLTPIK